MSFFEAIDKVFKRQFVFKIKVVPNSFCFFVIELCEDKQLIALAREKNWRSSSDLGHEICCVCVCV